ncbi:MAG: two-component system, OmpR family, heavy metal sensor histidine kinase CusS [Actinomycetota bacterium]|jgi:heavy metal sensor kinase|nr:two-component system, OmpR family, heavy metal sensor histidine kinase CusS [Actinomycetota bacterium]
MNLSIKVRLTVWYLALLTLILVAFGTFVFLRLKSDLIHAVDQSLQSRTAQITLGYQQGDQNFQDVSDASLRGLAPNETAAQRLSATGSVLDATGDPAIAGRPMISPTETAAAMRGRRILESVVLGAHKEHTRVLALRLPGPGGPSVLVVASSLEGVDTSIHRLLVLAVTGIPVALLLAVLGGWVIARKALQPVARMTAEAQQIRADRLGDRIAIPPTDDELQRLASTLNHMLGRLQEGVDSQRRFVADASHDMRTPLTVMASEIDVALDDPQLSSKAARELLVSNREQVERMARMIENLLTLASIEDGQLKLLRRPIDLQDLATGAVAKLASLAARSGVQISANGTPAPIIGDPDRLTQVLTNLIENGVKYAGAGAKVHVSTWQRNGQAGCTVSDTGSGIPGEALPHLFERFFRVDASRSSALQGSGLGLAICHDIVTAHDGNISVESSDNGTSFSVGLPIG